MSIVLSMMFIGCGGGGSSSDSDTDNSSSSSTSACAEDAESVRDPYIVGNGEFTYKGKAYFKVNAQVEGSSCNIIAYDISGNSQCDMMCEEGLFSFSSSGGTNTPSRAIYSVDTSGNYMIKANAGNEEANGTIGIYSECITGTDSYGLDTLNVGLNTFAADQRSHLYKIELNQSSTVEVEAIDYSIGGACFYDKELEEIYCPGGYSLVIDLQAGTNYVLVMSNNTYEEETEFFVTITPN